MDTEGRLAYSLVELADRLGRNERALRRYARSGSLPTFWLGGVEMVSAETVRRLLAGELVVPPASHQ